MFDVFAESTEGLQSFRVNYLLQSSAVSSLDGETEDRFSVNPVPVAPQPQPPQQAQQQQPRPNQQRPNIIQNVNQFQDDNAVCGLPVAGFTQSLVIGGQAAGRGEW